MNDIEKPSRKDALPRGFGSGCMTGALVMLGTIAGLGYMLVKTASDYSAEKSQPTPPKTEKVETLIINGTDTTRTIRIDTISEPQAGTPKIGPIITPQ